MKKIILNITLSIFLLARITVNIYLFGRANRLTSQLQETQLQIEELSQKAKKLEDKILDSKEETENFLMAKDLKIADLEKLVQNAFEMYSETCQIRKDSEQEFYDNANLLKELEAQKEAKEGSVLVSEKLGFKKGSKITAESGKVYIYQGNNKWLLENTNAYFLAVDTKDGGFDLEWLDPKKDPAYEAAMNSKMTFVVHGEEITITQREYQQLSEDERGALMNGMTTEEYIEHWNKIIESAKKIVITQEEIDAFIRANS